MALRRCHAPERPLQELDSDQDTKESSSMATPMPGLPGAGLFRRFGPAAVIAMSLVVAVTSSQPRPEQIKDAQYAEFQTQISWIAYPDLFGEFVPCSFSFMFSPGFLLSSAWQWHAQAGGLTDQAPRHASRLVESSELSRIANPCSKWVHADAQGPQKTCFDGRQAQRKGSDLKPLHL